jgi:hypothetical protein
MANKMRTQKALEADYRTKALHKGKRISEDGNVYYENRPNRSDVNRTTKLAEGGGLTLSKDELKASLAKAQRQLELAEKMNAPQSAKDLANRKIADFKKQLEDADKAPEKKAEVKKVVKASLPVKKAKVVAKPSIPVKKDKAVVKPAMPTKKEKVISKVIAKSEKVAKPVKEEKFVEIDGKKYYESDKEFCDALTRKWEGRKASMKKANKKYKTKTISERIGGDIASAVIKTIEHAVDVKEAQIAKNPKLYFAKFEKVEASANVFAKSLKDLLGDDYDNSEVKAELEDIEKAIDKIKNKLKK